MLKRLCDICKKNDADIEFDVKRRDRIVENRFGYKKIIWSSCTHVDICTACANKLFEINQPPAKK